MPGQRVVSGDNGTFSLAFRSPSPKSSSKHGIAHCKSDHGLSVNSPRPSEQPIEKNKNLTVSKKLKSLKQRTSAMLDAGTEKALPHNMHRHTKSVKSPVRGVGAGGQNGERRHRDTCKNLQASSAAAGK